MFLFNSFSIKDNTEYCIFESINGKYLSRATMKDVKLFSTGGYRLSLINLVRITLGESVVKIIKMHESKYMVVTHPKRVEIVQGVRSFEYGMNAVPDELKEDIDIVMDCMKNNGNDLEFVSDKLRDNIYVVMAAVEQNGDALEHVSERLRNNEEVVKTSVSNWGWALMYASKRLKDNKKVVIAAITQNVHVTQFISDRLKKDPEIAAHIETVLKKSGN